MSAPSIPERLGLVDGWGLTLGGFLLSFVAGIAALAAVVFAAVTYGGRAYGRTTCRNFATETGFQTKFVILNWADSGTCLAKAPNGQWVLNTKVLQFVNGGKS